MPRFAGGAILLDVEGTTTSIDFVYETLFPHARRALRPHLERHGEEPATRRACERIARDAGHASLEAWAAGGAWIDLVEREVVRLMDGDVKATGLKELQGAIWRRGYEEGDLVAHVYDDVAPALERWRRAGLDVRIYSSGSVEAQRLLFRHSVAGDLTGFLSGHYDTTTGPKKEARSYRAIVADLARRAAGVLFVSDSLAELDAARAAGLATALSIRPGNPAVAPGHGHPEIRSFDEIEVSAA